MDGWMSDRHHRGRTIHLELGGTVGRRAAASCIVRYGARRRVVWPVGVSWSMVLVSVSLGTAEGRIEVKKSPHDLVPGGTPSSMNGVRSGACHRVS